MHLELSPYISELLYTHDCVIITDFGGFVANHKSSFLNPAHHTVSPPSKKIAFNASLKGNDGLLANHISRFERITYTRACEFINDFVDKSNQLLTAGEKITIGKIGLLYLDHEKNIQFIPDVSENYLLDSFGLTPVHSPSIKRDAPFEVKKVHHHQVKERKHRKKSELKYFSFTEIGIAAALLGLLFFTPNLVDNMNLRLGIVNPFAHHKPTYTLTAPTVNNPAVKSTVAEETKAEPPVEIKNDAVVDTAATSTIEAATTTDMPDVVNPAPATVQPAPISTNMQGSYFIAAGCFKKSGYAERLKNNLIEKGYPAEIVDYFDMQMVIFSRYDDRAMAKQDLGLLRDEYTDAWIYHKKNL